MRLLIYGRREFTDRKTAFRLLNKIPTLFEVELVISGKARGADTIGEQWAKKRGTKFRGFPANWTKYGRSAGPRRNQQMIDKGKPTHAVGLFGDLYGEYGGSWDMTQRLKHHKIETWIIKW